MLCGEQFLFYRLGKTFSNKKLGMTLHDTITTFYKSEHGCIGSSVYFNWLGELLPATNTSPPSQYEHHY